MTQVIVHTQEGLIKIELSDKTPKTTENFLRYAREGFYEGTLFHRVIPKFMIQGGGLNTDMSSKETHEPIENEAESGLTNDIGTIAMARTSAPHSASSQFFINVSNNSFLNFKDKSPQGYGYCVFGRVIEGMDIVEAISQVATTQRAGHQDVPSEPILIERVEIID